MAKNITNLWFAPYKNVNSCKKVIVIGGGISGATTAYSLATRGYKVTIYEKHDNPAKEASGNHQAVLYGSFTGNHTPILELSHLGYQCTQQLIKKMLQPNIDYQQCGVVQLTNPKNIDALKKLCHASSSDFCRFITQDQIKHIAQININCESGVFFPQGMWFHPKILINKLITHPSIKVELGQEITAINFDNNRWHIANNSKVIDDASNLVLCNSHLVNQFSCTKDLNLRIIRGQTTNLSTDLGLKTIICDKGYITPHDSKYCTLGATFKINQLDNTVRPEEHLENLNQCSSFLPHLKIYTSSQNASINPIIQHICDGVTGHAAIRSSTTDYMPVVGPIADREKFIKDYAKLKEDSKYKIDTPCPYLPGLFINVAHGAKGMLTAPISSEIIANYMTNEAQNNPTQQLLNALHPNRIYIKQIVYSQ